MSLAAYKQYSGNQPSSSILLQELNPYSLGMLIALYEHKVFVQSVLWNINPFDQWGVEKGKEIANQLLPILNGQQQDLSALDASTQGLLKILLGKIDGEYFSNRRRRLYWFTYLCRVAECRAQRGGAR